MRGGAGADIVVFNNVEAGTVRITNFEPGIDHLQFNATAAGVASGDVEVHQGLAAYVPDQHPAIIVDSKPVCVDLHGDGQSDVALATFDTSVSLHQSDFLFSWLLRLGAMPGSGPDPREGLPCIRRRRGSRMHDRCDGVAACKGGRLAIDWLDLAARRQ